MDLKTEARTDSIYDWREDGEQVMVDQAVLAKAMEGLAKGWTRKAAGSAEKAAGPAKDAARAG